MCSRRTHRIALWLLLCLWMAPCAFAAALPTTERVVLYASVDQNGDSLTLSGKICEPEGVPAKGIVLLPHYTISADKDAPSNQGTKEPQYIPEEYIVIMPDYIGFGVTKDRIHPYLAGELTARNCVDMLLSQALPDSLPVYVVGYSQGAASAMWIIKLLEEQYADRVRLKQGFVGSGPYDVAAMYDLNVAENSTNLPLSIPMLIEGTKVAYNLDLQTDEYYTPAMKRCYRRHIADKKKSVTALFFHMLNHKATHWLTPQALDKSHPQTSLLYSSFLRSSLVHYPLDSLTLSQKKNSKCCAKKNNRDYSKNDNQEFSSKDNLGNYLKDTLLSTDTVCPAWQPRTPVYVFHSTNDDVVPFFNSEHLRRCFVSAPFTYDFGKYGSHLKSSPAFFTRVRESLSSQSE